MKPVNLYVTDRCFVLLDTAYYGWQRVVFGFIKQVDHNVMFYLEPLWLLNLIGNQLKGNLGISEPLRDVMCNFVATVAEHQANLWQCWPTLN